MIYYDLNKILLGFKASKGFLGSPRGTPRRSSEVRSPELASTWPVSPLGPIKTFRTLRRLVSSLKSACIARPDASSGSRARSYKVPGIQRITYTRRKSLRFP